jgi:H+/Cl- antiporter ClcA
VLPLDQTWYRRLLALSIPIGLTAGVLALLYTVVTGAGIDLLFDAAASGWWSGEWWWIPLIAAGGLLVALLRRGLDVPEDVPGAIAYAHQAWVDPAGGPRLVLVSLVSLIVGASLGPSFGLIVMGGSLGAWVVTRFGSDDEEAREEYTLTGMAGGLGAAFSSPLFAVLLTTELSPPRNGATWPPSSLS